MPIHKDLPDSEDSRANISALENLAVIDRWVSLYSRFVKVANIVDGDYLGKLLKEGGAVFEGAQGVLLDRTHGFFPYNTGTCTTFQNAEILLREAGYNGDVKKVGVIRAYATRHGAGPFVSEDRNLTKFLPDPMNKTGQWQGDFRIGYLDLVTLRYALDVLGGIDCLAVTNLDRLRSVERLLVCTAYGISRSEKDLFSEFLATMNVLAKRIKVLKPTDNNYQVRLTQQLQQSYAYYSEVAPITDFKSACQYASDIVSSLGISRLSGLILSHGPTWKSKSYFSFDKKTLVPASR